MPLKIRGRRVHVDMSVGRAHRHATAIPTQRSHFMYQRIPGVHWPSVVGFLSAFLSFNRR